VDHEGLNRIYKNKSHKFVEGDYEEIRDVLMAVERGELAEHVMTLPPVMPKAGSVILYKKEGMDDKEYMRDQYFRFISKGITFVRNK